MDHEALNIPTYPTIVKNPMDLSTIHNKLKKQEYDSLQGFVNDFNLIIDNARLFNGPEHLVTQAGEAMEKYFHELMESVPSTNVRPAAERKQQPATRSAYSTAKGDSSFDVAGDFSFGHARGRLSTDN